MQINCILALFCVRFFNGSLFDGVELVIVTANDLIDHVDDIVGDAVLCTGRAFQPIDEGAGLKHFVGFFGILEGFFHFFNCLVLLFNSFLEILL